MNNKIKISNELLEDIVDINEYINKPNKNKLTKLDYLNFDLEDCLQKLEYYEYRKLELLNLIQKELKIYN